jgi:hypothetical protein
MSNDNMDDIQEAQAPLRYFLPTIYGWHGSVIRREEFGRKRKRTKTWVR